MPRMRSLLVLMAVALTACVPLRAQAQTKTGTTVGTFLLIEPSARVAGMGNAGASLYEGLDGYYYNPAAIGGVRQNELHFTHSAWLADIGYDYAALALPVGSWGVGAVSITALHSGDMPVRTVAQPLGTGERFSVTDIALGLGFARQITERFSAGGQVSWIQETIWHTSMNTVVLNVGTIYRISKNGLHLGSSISNFGTRGIYDGRDLRITYDADPTKYGDNATLPAQIFTENFGLPVLFRVGAGYPLRLNDRTTLRLAADAFHPSDNDESVSAGAELSYRDLVSLRMGWQNAFLHESEVGFTLGGGVRGRLDIYSYHLDYAWADHGRLNGTHRVSVGLSF